MASLKRYSLLGLVIATRLHLSEMTLKLQDLIESFKAVLTELELTCSFMCWGKGLAA